MTFLLLLKIFAGYILIGFTVTGILVGYGARPIIWGWVVCPIAWPLVILGLITGDHK